MSSAETVLYQNGDLLVTTKRVIINGTTLSVGQIASVSSKQEFFEEQESVPMNPRIAAGNFNCCSGGCGILMSLFFCLPLAYYLPHYRGTFLILAGLMVVVGVLAVKQGQRVLREAGPPPVAPPPVQRVRTFISIYSSNTMIAPQQYETLDVEDAQAFEAALNQAIIQN